MKSVQKLKVRTTKTRKSPRHRAKLVVKKNRLFHHRIVLHPLTVFLLLCTGVLIMSWTYRAAADTYIVTGKVAAPALVDAATISAPTNGANFSASQTVVEGTCPVSSYVVLHRNAAISGMALCAANGTYQIQTSLYPNSNILKVQDFNLTDDPGPSTPEVTVTYSPLIPPHSSTPAAGSGTTGTNLNPSSSSSQTPAAIDLPLLTSNFSYQTFASNKPFTWSVEISGGIAPYELVSNWGDGTTSTQQVAIAQVVVVSHVYKKPGHYKVIFKIIDARGSVSILQLVAVIRIPGSIAINNTRPSNSGNRNPLLSAGTLLLTKHWLAVAWGSYATVSLMAISFWLGERQKVMALINLKHASRRHHKA